jgi:protein-tyrosine phosphatase
MQSAILKKVFFPYTIKTFISYSLKMMIGLFDPIDSYARSPRDEEDPDWAPVWFGWNKNRDLDDGEVDLCGSKLVITNLILDNDIGQIPECLPNMIYLRQLSLRNAGLSAFPMAVYGLVLLEKLDLGQNKISVIPRGFGDLSKLSMGWLDQNRLRSFPWDELDDLSPFTRLDLRGNYIDTATLTYSDRAMARNKCPLLCQQKTPSTIIAGQLYLGGLSATVDCAELMSLNIGLVLSFGVQATVMCPNSNHVFWDIPDTPETDIVKYIPRAIRLINECIDNGRAALVHCAMGHSRSVSIVCGYIMVKRNTDFDNALEFVRSKRYCVKPNDGFTRQLRMVHRSTLKADTL